MLPPRILSAVLLMLLGVSFAGGNLWFAAARSTIPLELHGRVTDKQRLIEKTPGVDDVYLVTLDAGRNIQVDGKVFDFMAVNQSVGKRAWTTSIELDGERTALSWSEDFRGMLWAMPITVGLLLGTLVAVLPRRTVHEQSDAPKSSIGREFES